MSLGRALAGSALSGADMRPSFQITGSLIGSPGGHTECYRKPTEVFDVILSLTRPSVWRGRMTAIRFIFKRRLNYNTSLFVYKYASRKYHFIG